MVKNVLTWMINVLIIIIHCNNLKESFKLKLLGRLTEVPLSKAPNPNRSPGATAKMAPPCVSTVCSLCVCVCVRECSLLLLCVH